MTDLSLAAQAVLHAVYHLCPSDQAHRLEARIAAALRAVAEHCVPDDSEGHWVYIPHVLAIAHELEALDD